MVTLYSSKFLDKGKIMVQSRKTRKDKKKLLGNHQRSWIWGRHAVLEILEAGRWPMKKLYLSDALDASALADAQTRADELGYTVAVDSGERLRELCRSGEHQGYLAQMMPYIYASAAGIKAHLTEDASDGRVPVVALLDSIQDPFNFGAIARSAEVLGIDGIIIGSRNQVEVTSMVARSSVGAVNHVPIAQVDDLVEYAKVLRSAGVTLVAATEKSEVLCSAHPFDGPTVIVLGNEGEGIQSELLEQCNVHVAIPQQGQIDSLNVAAAAAILFYEARRTSN
jgi:23S rRNA (guanosine2251-2'-O)-methyltransferase